MHAALHLPGYIVEPCRVEHYLGRHVRLLLEFGQQTAQRLLGFSVTVFGCRIDPVDSGIDGIAQDPELGLFVLMDQYATNPTAAKNEFGNFQAGSRTSINCTVFAFSS